MDSIYFSMGMAIVIEVLRDLMENKTEATKAKFKKALLKLKKEVDRVVLSFYPEEFEDGDA